jgi:hypothetical protein
MKGTAAAVPFLCRIFPVNCAVNLWGKAEIDLLSHAFYVKIGFE